MLGDHLTEFSGFYNENRKKSKIIQDFQTISF